ncbi:MAG: sigma-70 family RNA polymerase sigma factor [Lachnospiraceae bacterium]|nr:sigma-70 family RNA polymerase sigma factor [Lachnospiraceae bacterium]
MQDSKKDNISPNKNLPDEVLYAEFLVTGDNNAFRKLLERHRESLALFVFSIVHNIDDAEDIMLDAFSVVASGTVKFKGKSRFKTWLFAIGRNLALKHLKKNRFLLIPIDDEMAEKASDAPLPDEELLKTERDRKLYEAMSKLNSDYRQALTLHFFEGMDTEQIAVVMGKNKKQIYNLIDRGKESLKSKLFEMGLTYP